MFSTNVEPNFDDIEIKVTKLSSKEKENMNREVEEIDGE